MLKTILKTSFINTQIKEIIQLIPVMICINNCTFMWCPVQRRPHRTVGPAVEEAARGSVVCCLPAVWAARRSCTAVCWGIVQASLQLLLQLQSRHPHLPWPLPHDPAGTPWYNHTETSFYCVRSSMSSIWEYFLFLWGFRENLVRFHSQYKFAVGTLRNICYMSPPGLWQQAPSEACQGFSRLQSSQLWTACLFQRWDHCGHGH